MKSEFYPLSDDQVDFAKFSIGYLSRLHDHLFVKGYIGELVRDAKAKSGYKWFLSPVKNLEESSSFILNFLEGVALNKFKELYRGGSSFNIGDFHVGFWVGAYVMLLDCKMSSDVIMRIFRKAQTNYLNCIFLNGNTVAVAEEFLENTCHVCNITSHFMLSQALDAFREIEKQKFSETTAFFANNAFSGELEWRTNLQIKNAVQDLAFVMTLIEFGKEYRKAGRTPGFQFSGSFIFGGRGGENFEVGDSGDKDISLAAQKVQSEEFSVGTSFESRDGLNKGSDKEGCTEGAEYYTYTDKSKNNNGGEKEKSSNLVIAAFVIVLMVLGVLSLN